MSASQQPASEADDVLPIPPGVTEVGIDEAMRIAVELHQQRRLEGAEALYRRILAAAPQHANAWCLLGVARHQQGGNDEALDHIRRAIELDPSYAGFHNNLGNVLAACGKLDQARAAYEASIAADPNVAEPRNNLGAVYRSLGLEDKAREQYEVAVSIDPVNIRGWCNLGLSCSRMGDLEGAIRHLVKAIELGPTRSNAADLLGMTYYKYGHIAEAAEVYRQWKEREPDNPVPAHMYAACSGTNVPARASDSYVEDAFDRFADSFEQVLNERLQYQAPQLCAELLAECLPPPSASLVVLDAGCGTGLCGPLILPWARDLWGIDLSVGMLEHARTKGCYHHLRKAELTEYLRGTPAQWDVIVSADTLCYFGDLADLMHASASSLRPGGVFVFTVEALPDDADAEFRIHPNGRYAHVRAYLDRMLAGAGLECLQARREILRMEGFSQVSGWLIAARRPG
jgi:predicted TPR repeat methyltransferase